MSNNVSLFWSDYNEDEDISLQEWRKREVQLPEFYRLSLLAHAHFGHNVSLYTYQAGFTGDVPGNATVKDADEMLKAETAYQALQAGHFIGHIANTVTLKDAAANNGVVMDMDAVVLNNLPRNDAWFASLPAKKTSTLAPQWKANNPPLYIHDNSWDGKALSCFPMKISDTTASHARTLAGLVEGRLEQAQHKRGLKRNTEGGIPPNGNAPWNFVVHGLKAIMRKDVKSPVFPPMAFCPVPAWLRSGRCYSLQAPTPFTGSVTKYGYLLPAIEDILQESFVVQHFFASSVGNVKKIRPFRWKDVKPGSLVAYEAQHILGKQWRKYLQ